MIYIKVCYPSNSLFNFFLKTNPYILDLIYFTLLCTHIKMRLNNSYYPYKSRESVAF